MKFILRYNLSFWNGLLLLFLFLHRCLHQILDELSEALSLNQALEEWPDVTNVLATFIGGRFVQERREGLLVLPRPLRQLRASDELAL